MWIFEEPGFRPPLTEGDDIYIGARDLYGNAQPCTRVLAFRADKSNDTQKTRREV